MARSPYLTGLGSVKPTQQGLASFDPGPVSPAAFGGAIAEGLGGLGDAMVSLGLQTQGPLDVVSVQKHQLNSSLEIQKWINDNAATANQPDYPQRAQEAFRQITEASKKQLEVDGYRPSQRAKNAMAVDDLQMFKTYGSEVLGHFDTARRTMVVTDTDQNLEKARAVAIASGDMEELNKQTSFGMHATKATLSPEQYVAFEDNQKQKNGEALVAHLNALQESTLRPDSTSQELDSALTQGQAEMQVAIGRGWIDAAKGDLYAAKWEENFKTRHYNALTVEGRQEFVKGGETGGSVIDRIINVESGGKANAANPASSAVGAGQFIQSTWKQFIEERHPDLLTQGEDIQKFRTDATLSREAVGWYAEKNGEYLKNQGLPTTDGALYLAHFLGPQGATSVLKAAPGTPIENVVGPGVVASNGFLRGKTAQDVVDWAYKKMEGAAGAPQLTGPYASLPADRQRQMIDQLQTDLAQQDAQRRAELTRVQASNNDIFQYNIAMMSQGGQAVLPAQVNDAVSGGLIDPGQGATLIDKINSANGYTLDVQRAVSAYQGGAEFNPLDPKSASDANQAFDWISQHSEADKLPTLVDGFVRQGVFPNKVRYAIEQGFTSVDPAAVGQAAQLAQRYAQTASEVLGRTDWGQELLKKANVSNSLASLYGTQRANDIMASWNDPERRIEQAALEPRLKSQLDTIDFKTVAAIPGFDTSNIPGVGTPSGSTALFQDQMVADFKLLYEQEFKSQRGGDARLNGADILARAQTAMTQIYGLSYIGTGHGIFVGQGELMKFPPEKAPGYSPIKSSLGGDGYNYIRENMSQHVLEFNGSMDNVKTVRLEPINEYALTAGDWAATASKPTAPSMPPGHPIHTPGQNPRYWIMFQREDAYGNLTWDRLPQPWMMTDAEIQQSNDYKVRELNRATAAGDAQIAAGKERTLEQKREEMRKQIQEQGLITPESNLSPQRQEMQIPTLKDTPIPEDTTQAPGQY